MSIEIYAIGCVLATLLGVLDIYYTEKKENETLDYEMFSWFVLASWFSVVLILCKIVKYKKI